MNPAWQEIARAYKILLYCEWAAGNLTDGQLNYRLGKLRKIIKESQ